MKDPIQLWVVCSVVLLATAEVCDLPQAALTFGVVLVVVGMDAAIRGRRTTRP